MIISAVLWLLLSVGFALIAPYLIRRVRPDAAVRLVVASSLALTGAGVFVLGAAAATWAGQRPGVAEFGEWSATKLHADSPIPTVVAVLSAVVLVASTLSLSVHGWRLLGALRAVRSAVAVPGTVGDLVVLDDPRPDAFATPWPHGRIVITSGLLAALEPDERTALIAHERSHLRRRHALWQLAMHASAAVNPMLQRACRATDHAIERWADEDAAAQVADRRLVARTVARASLLRKYGTAEAMRIALVAASGGDVPARVRALLAPNSTRGRIAVAVFLLFILGAVVATAMMQHNTDALFDSVRSR